MPSLNELSQSTKYRRVFSGIVLGVCILCLVLGVLGLTFCLRDTKKCHEKDALPKNSPRIAETSDLSINYTLSANCSSGVNLGDFVHLHVCWYEGEALLDIRQFNRWDGGTTIKGLGLKKAQWFKLIENSLRINKTIFEKEYEHRIFKYKDWNL